MFALYQKKEGVTLKDIINKNIPPTTMVNLECMLYSKTTEKWFDWIYNVNLAIGGFASRSIYYGDLVFDLILKEWYEITKKGLILINKEKRNVTSTR